MVPLLQRPVVVVAVTTENAISDNLRPENSSNFKILKFLEWLIRKIRPLKILSVLHKGETSLSVPLVLDQLQPPRNRNVPLDINQNVRLKLENLIR